MKIELKIFDPDVVDCSSGFVNIIPKEPTLRLLLEMILKIVESDFIKSIGVFRMSFQGNTGAQIHYESPYVCTEYQYNNKFFESRGVEKQNMNQQHSEESKKNKTYKLFVESLESASQRKLLFENTQIVEAGLSGVKEGIRVISTILDGNTSDYPSIIPKNLDTIVYLALSMEIGFVEGSLHVPPTNFGFESRRSVIYIDFYSDGLPLPEEEFETPIFSFMDKNIKKIFKLNWPDLFKVDFGSVEDEMFDVKEDLTLLDKRNKLNPKAFFFKSWYLPIIRNLILYDIKSDNIIAIYHGFGFYSELWVIVKDLTDVPKVDTLGVHFSTIDNTDMSSLRSKDLLYGTPISDSILKFRKE